MNNKIIKLVNSLKKKKGTICSVITSPEKYNQVLNAALYTAVQKQKIKTIHVGINKPHIKIQESAKINNNLKVFFIDGISKPGKSCSLKTCFHNPNLINSLTNLSIEISNQINNKNFELLIFDSISTLLVYNDVNQTERFIHYLINKLRALGMNALLIGAANESFNKIYPSICQSTDTCLKIK